MLSFYSPTTFAYTYGAKNTGAAPLEVTLDFSGSENLSGTGKGLLVKKVVKPGEIEFITHVQPGYGHHKKILKHSATEVTKK